VYHRRVLDFLAVQPNCDNITRDLLTNGTLRRYIDEFSVTGLSSNPTIFDQDIRNSSAYDTSIRDKLLNGKEAETIFFDLALENITSAADLFRLTHDHTNGVDGWVSLEVSPLLAHDTATTVEAAKELFLRAARPNVFITIPGTREGVPAIEEAIFAGVPVNVTLLFSHEQYLAAAEAYLRGVERRIEAGLNPNVPRWRRFSLAVGTPPLWARSLKRFVTGWALQSRRVSTLPIILSSVPSVRGAFTTSGPDPSACFGPAPASKTLQHPTSYTSKLWQFPSK
jgi:hypothetical protein